MAELSFLLGLTDEQAMAVRDSSPTLCIIAGPGSGKTTVLTRRIALRALDPNLAPKNTIAITFTNQAADELKGRLGALAVYEMPWIGTFHGFAFQIIRKFHQDMRQGVPSLITNKAKDIAWILKNDHGVQASMTRSAVSENINGVTSSIVISEIAREIEAAKAFLIKPFEYEAWRSKTETRPRLDIKAIANIFQVYEDLKARRNQIDFDDLVIRAGSILEENPSFAQTVRWWYRHFYVDEFQDVNLPQIRFLRNLVGDKPDLCVVGDPKQAIYTWNGASPQLMLDFDTLFPNATFRYLTTNFRSTPEIIDVANITAETFSDPTVARHNSSVFAQRQSGSQPRLLDFDTSEDECNFIANTIMKSINFGTRPSEIAILARTNSLLPQFASALTDLGVTHHIVGATQITHDAVTKSVLKHLAEVLGPRGRLGDALSHIDELITEYELEPASTTRSESAIEYLRQLAVEALRNDPRMDIITFTNYFKVRASDVSPSKKLGVTLTTLHRSKGLEWTNVYLVAVEQGILPHVKSTETEAYEEEKRLFYVGITRARDHLLLTYARRRGNSARERQSSDFLEPTKGLLGFGLPERASTADALRFIQSNRTLLNQPRATALKLDPVQETLALWCKRKSNDLGCNTTEVMQTTVLASIALQLPTSLEDLALCNGVSKKFITQYGDEITKLCYALRRATRNQT